MSRSLLVSLSLLVWLVASACSAQLRKPSLHWTRGVAAAGCIDPRSLATRVEELTGPVLVGPRDSDYAIEGHIEAHAGGFGVRLSVTDRQGAPRGERLVEHAGADCRAFDQTVVFLIALTIDPDLALESAVPATGLGDQQPGDVLLQDLSAHPPVPVQLTPAPPPLPKPIVVAPVPQAIRWNVGLGLSSMAGELPRPGLGLSVGLSLHLTRWLSLAAQVRSSSLLRSVEVGSMYRLRATSFAAAVMVCAATNNERTWSFSGCLGPEPSRLRARGLEFSRESVATLTSWGALVRLELSRRLSPVWSLALQTFLRTSFQDKQLVYTTLSGERQATELGRLSGGATLMLIRRLGSGNTQARGTKP